MAMSDAQGADMSWLHTTNRLVQPLQKSVINPIVKVASGLGLPPPGDALLETIGRHTGKPRRTPICNALDGETFWLVSQNGRSSDYVRNIEANPHVEVRTGRTGWRSGTARILDDDDPRERLLILSQGDFWRRLCVRASGTFASNALTLRIDLDPARPTAESRRA
jgi:deazaflavin-dependent oxidoreductase (nitroreductase family)